MIKRISVVILMLVTMATWILSACGDATQDDNDTTKATEDTTVSETITAETDYSEKVYKAASSLDLIKVVGRSNIVQQAITCDWPASGIEFEVNCKGNVKVKIRSDASCYFTVFVDGERQNARYLASAGEINLVIAKDLPEGKHTFRLLKQSRVIHSMTSIMSITVNGVLLDAPQNKEHYIEFIGDSITAGYGVIYDQLVSGVNYGTYEHNDATQTYAFLTAEKLGVDYSMFAVSGWGISCGNTTIPQIYSKINWRRGNDEYSFERKPDLVVINLGTNDYGKSITAVKFIADSKAFINSIREKNGNDIPIIWVYNMMNDGHQVAIRQVISDMGGEGAGLYALSVERDRSGGSNHPSINGHKKAADALTDFIKEKNLLK